MGRIRHIVRKEFLQLRRDRRMLPMVFVAPILQLTLLGYAATTDVKDIPTAVWNLDRSRESRIFLDRFEHSGYFTLSYYVDDPEELDRLLDTGKATVGISIPRGFAEDLARGVPAQIQVIVDGTNSNTATIASQYAGRIVARYAYHVSIERRPARARIGRVEPEPRVWYNPDLKSSYFMIPGVLCLILMLMTMILTSMAVVKEREIGTMEQLIVTPIRPRQLILGKLIPFVLIGLVDIVLVLLVAAFWFRVPIRGNVPLLFGLSLLFQTNTLGLGLFISTISRTQQQAMLTGVFFVMLPFIMLSGFVFPINNMPRVIQLITYAIPLRYFLVIVRGLFLKGVGIEVLWPQGLALAALGTVILTTSILRFRKRLE